MLRFVLALVWAKTEICAPVIRAGFAGGLGVYALWHRRCILQKPTAVFDALHIPESTGAYLFVRQIQAKDNSPVII